MKLDAQRRKIPHLEPDTTPLLAASTVTLPAAAPLLSTTQAAATSPISQPSTSHAAEGKEKEDKTLLLTIREDLLQTHEENEDTDSDEEIIMMTKRRLKKLTSSHCSCPDPTLEYSFKPEVYEKTVTIRCTTCNFKNTSQPEVVEVGSHKKKIGRTNIALIYLSVIEDTGFAGVRRMMGALGMPPVGNFKY